MTAQNKKLSRKEKGKRTLLRLAHFIIGICTIVGGLIHSLLHYLYRRLFRNGKSRLAALMLVSAIAGFRNLEALQVPVRELVRISSMRENQLVGYGVVAGLSQSGDSRNFFASESVRLLLSERGIQFSDRKSAMKNVAAVMVTANIRSRAATGDRIDIWVSSIGDAKSLSGGYLLQTPLSAADGQIYAVAQGSLPAQSSSSDGGRKTTQPYNNVYAPGLALVEKQVEATASTATDPGIRLIPFHDDILVTSGIVKAVNTAFSGSASAQADGSILITGSLPADLEKINRILELTVDVKPPARVVIDPRSATIVMGDQVSISAVTVSHRGMKLQINQNRLNNDSKEKSFVAFKDTPKVSDLVTLLNETGFQPEEIMDILKAIHAAGALHGELIIL